MFPEYPVVLVTGGSRGIGRGICLSLARAGFGLAINYATNASAAEECRKLCIEAAPDSKKGKFKTVQADISNRRDRARLIEFVERELGWVDILVNNAGVHDDAVFPGMRQEQWDRVIDVSLNGFYRVTQPLMLPMIRTRWGRVITITSVAAIVGNRGQVNYAAAKGALHAATRSLALEVASRGITVNAVAPGISDTPMSEASFDRESIARLVPAQRAGTPSEVADLVAFLASERAGYITGQVISINGGMA